MSAQQKPATCTTHIEPAKADEIAYVAGKTSRYPAPVGCRKNERVSGQPRASMADKPRATVADTPINPPPPHHHTLCYHPPCSYQAFHPIPSSHPPSPHLTPSRPVLSHPILPHPPSHQHRRAACGAWGQHTLHGFAIVQSLLVGLVQGDHAESYPADDDQIDQPPGRSPEVDQLTDLKLHRAGTLHI